MNEQENQQSSVEDLTVTEEQAADVKGGIEVPYYLKLATLDGDVTHIGGKAGYDFKQNEKI